jgi:hypothetical protein
LQDSGGAAVNSPGDLHGGIAAAPYLLAGYSEI